MDRSESHVLDYHGYWENSPFYRTAYNTYINSEKGSDKYKYSWEVCCCPSVVTTLSTMLYTEQLKNKFMIGLPGHSTNNNTTTIIHL